MTLQVNFKPIPKKFFGMKLVKTFTDYVNFPEDGLDKEFFTNCPSNYVGKAVFALFNATQHHLISHIYILDPKSKFLEELLKRQKFDPIYEIYTTQEGWTNAEFKFINPSHNFSSLDNIVQQGKIFGYKYDAIQSFLEGTSQYEENLKNFNDFMTGKTVGIVKNEDGSEESLYYAYDVEKFIDEIVEL